MKLLTLDEERDLVFKVLDRSPLFHGQERAYLDEVAEQAELWHYDAKDLIARQDDPSDAFFLILKGQAEVVREQAGQPNVQLAILEPTDSVGEMGLLLGGNRSASVFALTDVYMLKFSSRRFHQMLLRLPYFGLVMCRTLAGRIQELNARLPAELIRDPEAPPTPEILRLAPLDFQIRHRFIPLELDGGVIRLGYVEELSPSVLEAIQRQMPGLSVQSQRISKDFFERVMSTRGSVDSTLEGHPEAERPSSPILDGLLRRALAEGVSDVHLSTGQRPYWRVNGEVRQLKDLRALGPKDVMHVIEPILPSHSRVEFEARHSTNFAYGLSARARFRVNLFEDLNGPCASIRCIPAHIPTPKGLGLSQEVVDLCAQPRGLILVAGPNRAGKSTTLAALVEHINQSRPVHIVTLEEPVEFVHESRMALVHQREVGRHTESFIQGIEAVLREAPDVLVVGDVRDFQTLNMVLKSAERGLLVLASMNTSTTLSTLDHIFSLTPPQQQTQTRHLLANTLLGLINQRLMQGVDTLTRVFEILLGTPDVLKRLRAGEIDEILQLMEEEEGHQRLDQALTRLVLGGAIEYEEAICHALEPVAFAERFGRSLDEV